jgi:hypothetical protein
MSNIRRHAVALGVVAALAIGGAAQGIAAPVASSTVAVKQAAPNDVIDVWHRRRSWRRHAPALFALGVLGTIAAAHHYDRYHRYRYRYPYGYPYAYAYPYRYRYGPGW